jgi:hypothetical protein
LTPPGWRLVDVAVDDDGEHLRARLESGAEVRHVELSAGLLATLGALPHLHDGRPMPAALPGTTDEWGRLA